MQRINHARADAHLSNAYAAGESGDWKQSERLSLAAWQLKEGDSQILRQLFLSARELKSRHLLIAAGALFDHPEATSEDRLEVLELHLQMGDYVSLKHLLTQLSAEELEQPAAKHIGIRFFLARQDGIRVLALTEKLLAIRSGAIDRLLAAEVYATVPTRDHESQAKAQEIIFDLFLNHEDPSLSLAAFSLLSKIDTSLWQADFLATVADRLTALKAQEITIPVAVELLGLEVAMALSPQSKEPLFKVVIDTFGKSHPLEVGSWLMKLNRPELVESLLTAESASVADASSLLFLNSLITQEKWEAAAQFISQPHPAIPPVTVMSLRAIISAGLGQDANAKSYWDRALDHAMLAGGRSSLIELARFASSEGDAEIRNRALTEALKRPASINLPAEDVSFLFAHLSKSDESESLLTISRNLLKSEPNNPVLINNVTWLELVSGRIPRSAAISALVAKHPDIRALRSTLTLALLAEGHHEAALEAVAPLLANGIGSRELSPTDHAVIALAYQRNGESLLAASAKAKIDWSRLMTVERRFFNEALSLSTASVEAP